MKLPHLSKEQVAKQDALLKRFSILYKRYDRLIKLQPRLTGAKVHRAIKLRAKIKDEEHKLEQTIRWTGYTYDIA